MDEITERSLTVLYGDLEKEASKDYIVQMPRLEKAVGELSGIGVRWSLNSAEEKDEIAAELKAVQDFGAHRRKEMEALKSEAYLLEFQSQVISQKKRQTKTRILDMRHKMNVEENRIATRMNLKLKELASKGCNPCLRINLLSELLKANVVQAKWFRFFILFAIMVAAVLIGLEEYHVWEKEVFDQANKLLFSIFFMEFALKVVAEGLLAVPV
jgi:hypothetical protein